MAKSSNQKLKLLYLMKILLEQSDEEHPLPIASLIEELHGYSIAAERKSLYDDLELLRLFGLDVEHVSTRPGGYYIGERSFQLPELKLLVDAVQSSKFVTAKKSSELIHKLEGLASRYQAGTLQRQVFVSGRVKSMNESVYYSVDKLHEAISKGRQVRFRYDRWVVSFSGGQRVQRQPRRDGSFYLVSPWALAWEGENYYLVGFDGEAGRIKHYRVDKLSSIEVMEEDRQGQEHFQRFDMAAYSRGVFGMYGGEEQQVRLRFHNELIGVVVDRFGRDVFLSPWDDAHFAVSVRVQVSPQFFGWLFGLGEGVKVLAPPEVAQRYCDQARKLLQIQEKEE